MDKMAVRDLDELIQRDFVLGVHPQAHHLLHVIQEKTYLTKNKYPYISETAFIRFIHKIPHLFTEGLGVLRWLHRLEPQLQSISGSDHLASIDRAIFVIRSMVLTAAVTAPTDLWLLRQVLSEHKRLGILDDLLKEEFIDPAAYSLRKGLNARQLKIGLHFLYSRGLLGFESPCFMAPSDPAIREGLSQIKELPEPFRLDWVYLWTRWFTRERITPSLNNRINRWLTFEGHHRRSQVAWAPTHYEIELGYRLVPIVLALRAINVTNRLGRGEKLGEIVPNLNEGITRLFETAGMLAHGKVTNLGERVFKRAPGPFGIIAAYYPYMNKLDQILKAKSAGDVWVNRAHNTLASQDANAKTFRLANHALDDFCREEKFSYSVFIEHAVGRGEATRQRHALSPHQNIRYFGADLEEAALKEAEKAQQKGLLPANMKFIPQADIGEPAKVTDFIREEGLATEGAVMMVGNGFHEIRRQTNHKMYEVFKGYREAGILLIFTEETGLTDADLRSTAWNTYHAGFRYVHEMSGQGLRPSWDLERLQKVWSWRRCAEEAGYKILPRYTRGTRPIYPIRKKGRHNPSISTTYFCVPEGIMNQGKLNKSR